MGIIPEYKKKEYGKYKYVIILLKIQLIKKNVINLPKFYINYQQKVVINVNNCLKSI